MKEQKFLIVELPSDVNGWLDKGWEVVSVVPQHVSMCGGQGYPEKMRGYFAVVIQNQQIK